MRANQSGAGGPPLADVLVHAARAWRLFAEGTGLGRALQLAADALPAGHPRRAAAAQDVLYTAVRSRALLDVLVARLAARKPAPPVAALLAVALAQLLDERHPAHTVVDQAVHAARADRRTAAAAGFVNATLRAFVRARADLLQSARADETVRLNAPRWWIDRLRTTWPERWQQILQAQGEAPPLVLRVNRRRTSVDDYLARLAHDGVAAMRVGESAVWLRQPRPVQDIPGFDAGEVSVQDAGGQLAAPWLDAAPGSRVLDACAAPGGKTGHLAELADASIDAVELEPDRAQRIRANLDRLGFGDRRRVRVLVGDAARPQDWAGAARYDRILLDAPCTASGIVRRHPDIPWLRRPGDVAQLATIQTRLLDALWPLLAPAGRLLYVVCSLFEEEAALQAARFLADHADARPAVLPGTRDVTAQLLPSLLALAGPWAGAAATPSVHDGFFYALFEKR